MNFTGNIGSANSSNGPNIVNTDGSEKDVPLLLPKVLSILINIEVISLSATKDVSSFTII